MSRMKNDGRGRLGGRAKGTPNKITTDLKTWIKDLLLGNTRRFEESLNTLPPEQYIQAYLRLINYIVPKQRPVEEEPPPTGLLAELNERRRIIQAKYTAMNTAASEQ